MKKLAQQDLAPALKYVLVELWTDYGYYIEKLHEDLYDKIKFLVDEYIKDVKNKNVRRVKPKHN